MAEKKGKLSKTGRASTHFGTKDQTGPVIENDSSRGKVFVEVKNLLVESKIGFQNISSSHPVIINKGSFDEAVAAIKGALVETGKYGVEKEEPGHVVFLENAPKDPGRMVVKESPFSWYAAG